MLGRPVTAALLLPGPGEPGQLRTNLRENLGHRGGKFERENNAFALHAAFGVSACAESKSRTVSAGDCALLEISGYSRGSTGSLSSASTPNTHSCTRRRGSPRTKRSSPSIPNANSRSASDRFGPRRRDLSRSRCSEAVVFGSVDNPKVLTPPALHRWLNEPAPAFRDKVEGLHDHPFAAA